MFGRLHFVEQKCQTQKIGEYKCESLNIKVSTVQYKCESLNIKMSTVEYKCESLNFKMATFEYKYESLNVNVNQEQPYIIVEY